MQISFTRHIFGTLTYSRDYSLDERWNSVSSHFNRFMQNYRKLHSLNIAYLRVVEKHQDGYPHIHCLIQFPDARIRVENSRYFDTKLYERWRLLWKHGYSDYQKPRREGINTLSYILKYCLKNQTQKTVWKNVFKSISETKTDQQQPNTLEISQEPSSSVDTYQEKLPTHYRRVKLCSWSRNFDFTVFLGITTKRALSKNATRYTQNTITPIISSDTLSSNNSLKRRE